MIMATKNIINAEDIGQIRIDVNILSAMELVDIQA